MGGWAALPPHNTIRSRAGGRTEVSGWTRTDSRRRVTTAETESATDRSRSRRETEHGLPPSWTGNGFLARAIRSDHAMGGDGPGRLSLRSARGTEALPVVVPGLLPTE